MKTEPDDMARVFTLSVCACCVLLISSCIFDSPPVEPGYPGDFLTTLDLSAIGAPEGCTCTSSGRAVAYAGSTLLCVDLETGVLTSTLELETSVIDIGDTDASEMAWVLTSRDIVPLDAVAGILGTPLPVGEGCVRFTVSSQAPVAYVVMQDDSLAVVDLVSGSVSYAPGGLFSNCTGISAATSSGEIFVADGQRLQVVRIDPSDWSETGSCDTWNQVIDLFPGPAGSVCCLVEGSNELWFIEEDGCSVRKMMSFPAVPIAAASMPDGTFGFASCPELGLVVVSQSGQIEERMDLYGLPDVISLSADGNRAVLCSSEEPAIHLLER